MITHIWLKSQPNKKLSYPDCLPIIKSDVIWISNPKDIRLQANFLIDSISRVEFRP
jgi:hypothetical protein